MMMTTPSPIPNSDQIEARCAAQPLLQDVDCHLPEHAHKSPQSHVSLRSLEDGEDSEFEFEHPRAERRQGFWRRLHMSMQRRRHTVSNRGNSIRLNHNGDANKTTQRCRWRGKLCLALPLLVVCLFGFIHILNFLLGYVPLLWDDPAASPLDRTYPGQATTDVASRLLDITHDVTPIPCHSHNDYWRRVPLYDALRWGCTGVEADVWLFDQELYVGHSTNALTQNRTFRSMYVEPLVKMLDYRNKLGDFAATSGVKNGIFEVAPEQTLVLLVDFKNDGRDIFPFVSQHLHALREKGYLTFYNGETIVQGPITIVATGNAPFDLITANTTYRDVFFDAPLDRMYEEEGKFTVRGGQGTVGTTPSSHFDSTNSYYASVDFRKAIGFVWWGTLSEKQLKLVRGQIRGAHQRGLKARYWSAPKWPIGLRNRIWNLLVEEGVDYLNGDDLQGMTRLDWGIKRHWSLLG